MQELTKKDVKCFKDAVRTMEAAEDTLGHMRVAHIGIGAGGTREVLSIQPMHFYHIESETETACYAKTFSTVFNGGIRKRIYASQCSNNGDGTPLNDMLENGFTEENVSEYIGHVSETVNEDMTNFVVILAIGSMDMAVEKGGEDGHEKDFIVHKFIMCIICPMQMSGERLVCENMDSYIKDDVSKWVVNAPICAITYPAIIGGVPDNGYALYYTKKSDVDRREFLNMSVGAKFPLMESDEKAWFNNTIAEISGGACELEKMQSLGEAVTEHVVTSRNNEIGKDEMKKVMHGAGFNDGEIEAFCEAYEGKFEPTDSLSASNIAGGGSVKISDDSFDIKTDDRYFGRMTTTMIGGRRYLALPLDNNILSVNGVLTDMRDITGRRSNGNG